MKLCGEDGVGAEVKEVGYYANAPCRTDGIRLCLILMSFI